MRKQLELPNSNTTKLQCKENKPDKSTHPTPTTIHTKSTSTVQAKQAINNKRTDINKHRRQYYALNIKTSRANITPTSKTNHVTSNNQNHKPQATSSLTTPYNMQTNTNNPTHKPNKHKPTQNKQQTHKQTKTKQTSKQSSNNQIPNQTIRKYQHY